MKTHELIAFLERLSPETEVFLQVFDTTRPGFYAEALVAAGISVRIMRKLSLPDDGYWEDPFAVSSASAVMPADVIAVVL